MTLLLRSIIEEAPVTLRIGSLVHLSDTARPAHRRCCPALVTRVLEGGEHPALQLDENVAYSGNAKAKHPTGGWRHMTETAGWPSSWHLASECPDGL
jgi:CO/xanthine dehydrogenase FAD-binding subunit